MQISGTSDREPLKHGLRQSLWCGGLNAAYATLAAHLGGGGVHVDLSLQECVASELRAQRGALRVHGRRAGPPAAGWGSAGRRAAADRRRARLAADERAHRGEAPGRPLRRPAPRRSALREHRVAHAQRGRAAGDPRRAPLGGVRPRVLPARLARGIPQRLRADAVRPPVVPPARGARGLARVRRPARRALPREDRVAVGHAAAGPRASAGARRHAAGLGRRGRHESAARRPWPGCASSTSRPCSPSPTWARSSPTSGPRSSRWRRRTASTRRARCSATRSSTTPRPGTGGTARGRSTSSTAASGR